MRNTRVNIILGLLLVLLGGYWLAVNFEVLPGLAVPGWAVVFSVAGILFLSAYLATGLRGWGWLFPALGSGALAVIITFAERDAVPGEWLGSLFLLSLAVPFWVAYLVERGRHWWPLIPAWALTVIGVIPALSAVVEGEVIGALFLYAAALPFAVVYLRNRRHWWALIPAGILFFLGTIPLLASSVPEEIVGGVFMLGLAAIFLFLYLFRPDNWWALIPAGVLATIGVTAGLSNLIVARALEAIFFGGMALMFLILWLLRGRYGTGWALYPAALLVVLAAFSALVGSAELLWPVVLLAAGAWLIFRAR